MERATHGHTVAEAGYLDMLDILEMSSRFFLESNFRHNMTFDPDKLRDNLFIAWAEKPRNFITLIVRDDCGQPAGFAHVRREDVFTVESLGEIYQFYILPEYRATGASRTLRDAVDQVFRSWECRKCYAEYGSGLEGGKNEVLFFNLWAKIGYKFLGRTLYREG